MVSSGVASASAPSLSAFGDHPVDVPITCVITRFGLRHTWQLLPTYIGYRLVRREAAKTPGLLRAAFMIEGWRSCYSFSIWESPDAILVFGTRVPEHVNVANRVFSRLANHDGRGPELWSTKWTLARVSHNLNWDDFDLRWTVETMSDRGEVDELTCPDSSDFLR